MSVKQKQDEAAQHIQDIDEQIKEVDRHIQQARQQEKDLIHPAPGIDITAPPKGPASPGQFGG